MKKRLILGWYTVSDLSRILRSMGVWDQVSNKTKFKIAHACLEHTCMEISKEDFPKEIWDRLIDDFGGDVI